MKNKLLTGMIACAVLTIASFEAQAAGCVAGVYRVGCAGPNGAVVVNKHPPGYRPPVVVHPPMYRPPAHVVCANGPYRAGCAGPNGAAVIRK